MSSEECKVYTGEGIFVHTPFFVHMQIISVIALREQKEKQTPATNRADFYVTLMRQRDNRAMWNVVKLIKKKKKNRAIMASGENGLGIPSRG